MEDKTLAISKLMWAAIKTVSALEPDVERSYKVERQVEHVAARLRGKPKDFKMLDQAIYVNGYEIPVRSFVPVGDGPFPLLLFFHGGGFVKGGIENYTAFCTGLAKATGCAIASVDYRLAPEHKFPVAPEDCYAVTRAFFMGQIPGVNPDDITLIGDSAGGNLAAVVSLMARDRGEFLPKRQILIYPSTGNDHSVNSPYPSVRENGKDYILTSKRVQSFMRLYRSKPEDLQNPYFAPLLASDLSNQPSTLVITAEYCPLRDEGEAYGERLLEAGGEAYIIRMPDTLHSYMMLPSRFKAVRMTYQIINNFLTGR